MILYGVLQQTAYQHDAQRRSAEYAKYSRYKQDHACVNVALKEQPGCKIQAQAEYEIAKRDNERNEYDLVAQRKAALWAFEMGVAALIGMGLSIVGVVLVYTTFRETKRNADIAQSSVDETRQSNLITLNQMRPILNCDSSWYTTTHRKIVTPIANKGDTSAIDVKVKTWAIIDGKLAKSMVHRLGIIDRQHRKDGGTPLSLDEFFDDQSLAKGGSLIVLIAFNDIFGSSYVRRQHFGWHKGQPIVEEAVGTYLVNSSGNVERYRMK